MITLYHCRGARSFRALWMLEEMALPYALKLLTFPPRVHEPEYLNINPLGTVPAMIDAATMMTESSAIIHYLATRYGPSPLAIRPDEPGYAAYLNFLFMGEATLTFPQTVTLRYGAFAPPEGQKPQVVADYTRWFAARFKAAEPWLGEGYAAAGRFTAADISLGYAIMLANAIGLAGAVPARAQAYWHALQQRPAFARAQDAENTGANHAA